MKVFHSKQLLTGIVKEAQETIDLLLEELEKRTLQNPTAHWSDEYNGVMSSTPFRKTIV